MSKLEFTTFSYNKAKDGDGLELYTCTKNAKTNVIVKGRYHNNKIGLIEFFDCNRVSTAAKLKAAKFFASEINKIVLKNYGLRADELL
jgi:hypothetical protein